MVLQTFIRDKNVDIVSLIEMVGWRDDVTDVMKLQFEAGSLTRRAGAAGLPYAAMLVSSSGYHIGTAINAFAMYYYVQ